MEYLDIFTNNNIEDDVGKLKHLLISSSNPININCPNLIKLSLYIAKGSIINCPKIESLKLDNDFNIDSINNKELIKELNLKIVKLMIVY